MNKKEFLGPLMTESQKAEITELYDDAERAILELIGAQHRVFAEKLTPDFRKALLSETRDARSVYEHGLMFRVLETIINEMGIFKAMLDDDPEKEDHTHTLMMGHQDTPVTEASRFSTYSSAFDKPVDESDDGHTD